MTYENELLTYDSKMRINDEMATKFVSGENYSTKFSLISNPRSNNQRLKFS